MNKGTVRKGLVFGIIVLMVGAGIVINNKTSVKADPSEIRYGFWPFWTNFQSYQPTWNCLTHVSYFSINSNQYGVIDTTQLNSNYENVRDTAHSNGVKVTLTLTTPGHDIDIYDYILANHREDLANNVLQTIESFNADGVCLDFELLREINSITHTENKILIEQFISTLYTIIKNENPNYHVSFCVSHTPEIAYRNPNLNQYTDNVFIMAYGGGGSWSTNTGPLSPYFLDNSYPGIKWAINKLEEYYSSEKVILGLPFYGWDWPCVSNEPRALTSGDGIAEIMKTAIYNSQNMAVPYGGRQWDSISQTPWYRYQSGGIWHQCWYDDTESLMLKINYARSENIGGVGFWALGYEGNDAEIWNIITSVHSRIYTLDDDFDEGTLVGLEHNTIHNQLQLSDTPTTYPMLWVANAGEDSISKWNTHTNKEIAKYHTWFGPLANHGAWTGPSPSRTCVDTDGNCYVANRHFDTYKPDVFKIYSDDWIDRNGNGIIDTSYDANGNGIIEQSEMRPMTDLNSNGKIDQNEITDERIAWVTQVNGNGLGRSLAIDLQGNIWLGCYDSHRYYKLDGNDGTIIGGPYNVGVHTPYGALVDKYGYLWGASLTNNILKLNTLNPSEYTIYTGANTYGIALGYDLADHTLVYLGYNTPFAVFNSATNTFNYPAPRILTTLGVATDSFGNIFTGSMSTGSVAKFAPDGTVLWHVSGQVYSEVRGVIVDAENNIWAIHRDVNKLCKYNGNTGAPMGVFNAGKQPYTYSDATGLGLQGSIENLGIWSVIFDSEESDTTWGTISWNSYTPTGTSLWVDVRSSNDMMSWSTWETALNNIQLSATPNGRYIQIKTTLRILTGENSPILYDLNVRSLTSSTPQSNQPQLKAPWIGIQKITQGNNAPSYSPYSHYDHGTWDNTYAIDIALPIGSDILAPADGIINWYDDDSSGSGGKELAIDHIGPTGVICTTIYLHLSEIIIKNGPVTQGQLVAKSGNTGEVTGPHLHFHIWSQTGSRDSHTIPIERFILKQIGIDNDFKEYDGGNGDLNNNVVEDNFFESNTIPLSDLIYLEAIKHSPVELCIQDSQMRVTGVLGGVEMNEIPNSVCINEVIHIYSPTDTYSYKLVGIGDGTYNLTIINHNPQGTLFFNTTNIPVITGASHVYSLNWDDLSQGLEGASIQIDADNDGYYEKTITSDSELTQEEYLFKTDDIPPSIIIETPSPWEALQDGVTFSSVVTDSYGVDWVKYAIREPGGLQGTIIDSAYESLDASQMGEDKWQLLFDTTQLDDGFYVLYVNATDNPGNEGYTTVNFSIRNWAVIENLPNTPNSKAGRTMPVKFFLRVAEAVDPTQPFVRNEELTIKIYIKGYPENILQTSIYGSGSTDYRINTTQEQYITNFKTLNTPKTYVVDIWRDTLLIGSFEFATVK